MKKILAVSALFLTISAALVGCGADRNNDSGYKDHDRTGNVTDTIRDRDDDTMNDASDRVKDAIDGAGDAANDIIDGAENAGDDIVDGVMGTRTDVKTTDPVTTKNR